MFGEVEKCNWDHVCVDAWDYNKAVFEAQTPEEQAKQIAEKQEQDKIAEEAALAFQMNPF